MRTTRRVGVTLDTVAATVPNRTMTPLWKFVPVIVTSVPPAMDPLAGAKLVTVGRIEASYVNAVPRVTVPPSGLVTLTATVPVAPAGVRTVSAVAVCCSSVAAVPPNRTTAPAWKPEPDTVTSVPPVFGPDDGDSPVIAGGGWYVNAEARVRRPAVGVGHADGDGARRPRRRSHRERGRRQLLHACPPSRRSAPPPRSGSPCP